MSYVFRSARSGRKFGELTSTFILSLTKWSLNRKNQCLYQARFYFILFFFFTSTHQKVWQCHVRRVDTKRKEVNRSEMESLLRKTFFFKYSPLVDDFSCSSSFILHRWKEFFNCHKIRDAQDLFSLLEMYNRCRHCEPTPQKQWLLWSYLQSFS